MAVILLHHKRNPNSNKRHLGLREVGNQFNLRPKTIVGIIISVLIVYSLSFLGLAVRVHRLDHSESKYLLKEIYLTSTNIQFDSTVDHENKGNNDVAIEKKKLKRSDKDKTKEPIKVPVALSKATVNLNNEKVDWSNGTKSVRVQETKQKSEKKGDPNLRFKRNGFQPNPHGHMVAPEIIITETMISKNTDQTLFHQNSPRNQILTAFLEVTDRSTWSSKPLPARNVKAEDLVETRFPKLRSCSKLPEQWPVDDFPDDDPFLPWIHDVFPTDDGKFIQFVAQNRRRCHTGTTQEEERILNHTEPQIALFQHIPLKKIENSTMKTPRYRLCSHEDADPESINTRFICRFKPSGDITFSEFNNDYEWTAFQKRQPEMFREDGRNNWQIQTSQLIFRCPVPGHLVKQIQTGKSVVDDWATIFVDLIPVRTPPRYGRPDQFLVPRYAKSVRTPEDTRFDPRKEWGEEHILPKLDDSGRWENIPICKPSLMTYEPESLIGQKRDEKIKHHLVSCLWASTGYATRGNRYAINDGQRRLLEWITFNKILGFDHFYIYDNSGAFTNDSSLQPIADMFPKDVTMIKWPSRVCNNNPNNVDSIGERSSQYAAETSCRLRFGSHVNWIGQFDIDEYLIPMGNFSSLLPLLEKLDDEGMKIINFASWRAWPRRTHIKYVN